MSKRKHRLLSEARRHDATALCGIGTVGVGRTHFQREMKGRAYDKASFRTDAHMGLRSGASGNHYQ